MGYALAEAARDLGAQVTLISGPTALPPRRDTTYQRGQRPGYARGEPGPSAQRCLYRPCRGGRLPTRQPSRQKLKKGQNDLSQIQLVQNPDVIATIAQSENDLSELLDSLPKLRRIGLWPKKLLKKV